MAAATSLTLVASALLAFLVIDSVSAQDRTITVGECVRLAGSVGQSALSAVRGFTCDPGFYRRLFRRCRRGVCDGLLSGRCERVLRRASVALTDRLCTLVSPARIVLDTPLRINPGGGSSGLEFRVYDSCWPSKVCVRISNPAGGLVIWITAPNESTVVLQRRVGGSGRDVDACYSNDFTATAESNDSGQAPVVAGNFAPVTAFPGSPLPGRWELRVSNQRRFGNDGFLTFATVTLTCV